MVQHIDPDLAVLDDLGRESVFEDLTRCHHRKDKAPFLQIILHSLPSQLEAVFKPLDCPLFFQLIQGVRSLFQRDAQQHKRAVKILKALLPPDVRRCTHSREFSAASHGVATMFAPAIPRRLPRAGLQTPSIRLEAERIVEKAAGKFLQAF